MHFLNKRTIFAGLLLIAGLATLHGTSRKKDEYDLTRKYKLSYDLLSGDVNLNERIDSQIKNCDKCLSNEHIMVNADALRCFFKENNKALFTAHKIKSFWLDGTSEHITEEEKESYFKKQYNGAPEFDFTAKCSTCNSDITINLYTDFDSADMYKIIRDIILYTQNDYIQTLKIKARLAEEAGSASRPTADSGDAYGYDVESSAASVSGDAGTGAGSGFGSADGGGYGYGGGSGAASAYDAENTAQQLADQARIAAERAKAEKAAGDEAMARLQAEIARKAGEELRARETSAAARKATFEATERLAEAEEKRLWKNPKLPTPNLQTLNRLLWNPTAKTTLFRSDVLVVTCEDEMPAGAQFQYKISNYRGPLGRVFSLWDDITRNDKGRHGFTLPPGEMKVQVRMITRDNNQVSPESLSYDIVVKGA